MHTSLPASYGLINNVVESWIIKKKKNWLVPPPLNSAKSAADDAIVWLNWSKTSSLYIVVYCQLATSAAECSAQRRRQSVWLIMKHSWHRTLRWSGIRVSVRVVLVKGISHASIFMGHILEGVWGWRMVVRLTVEALADFFWVFRKLKPTQ